MILFGIVCFREDYKKSVTYRGLIKSFINSNTLGAKLNIFIFDNTDLDDWKLEGDKHLDIKLNLNYLHDSQNPGISFAYNKIAEYAHKEGFDYIVFLDQDTELPMNFYNAYSEFVHNNIEIAAPIIMIENLIFSPSGYKNYRSINFHELDELQNGYINSKSSSCINSGLLIKTDFFFKVGGYDKRLRLDFCDHEFIRRVSKYKEQIKVIPIILNQMFSTEINSLEKALFRYKIFLRDLSSFKKINNNDIRIFFFIDLLHLIRLTIQYNTLKFIKIRMFN